MNLIIAPAFNYTYKNLKPFIESCRNSKVNAKILFLVNEKSDLRAVLAEDANFIIHEIPSNRRITSYRIVKYLIYPLAKIYSLILSPRISRIFKEDREVSNLTLKILHISSSRYFYALDFLITHGKELNIKKVMLTDTRDVIFQCDPFEKVDIGLYLSMESVKIGNEHTNYVWTKKLYKGNDFKFLKDQVASCSGVTIGDIKSVQDYLFSQCHEILRKLPILLLKPGFDQGVHNFIIHNLNKSNIIGMPNGNDLIATLGASLLSEFIWNGQELLTREGRNKVCIIHQYHPHPTIRNHVSSVYS